MAMVILVFGLMIYFCKKSPPSSWVIKYILGAVFCLIPVIQVIAIAGFTLPYRLFSRFGSYTMFRDGDLVLFGDLVHITSAAKCESEIQIGINLCDPWSRKLNQNTDVIRFFRYIEFTNPQLIGVASSIVMLISLFFLLKRVEAFDLITLIGVLSPPVILAIERGNEVITLTLILLAVLVTTNRLTYSKNAHLLLAVASLFKFWPSVVVIVFGILQKKERLIPLLSVGLISFYLFFSRNEILTIKDSTQVGSLTGNSFGVGLVNFTSQYDLIVTIVGTIFALSFLRIFRADICFDLVWQQNILLVGLLVTYVALWFTGPHFAYRLIVLVPVIILLKHTSGSEPLRILISLTMLSSRLPIGVILTTSLMLIFSSILLQNWRLMARQII